MAGRTPAPPFNIIKLIGRFIMKELQIIQHDGTYAADSREVSEMIEKRHDHLMRDIAGYCGIHFNY